MATNKRRFVVSVDTEEDIWGWASTSPVTCSNTGELLRLARFFEGLGVRPTFFVTYQVLSDPSSGAVIKELASEDWVEIGCHVHPWNTPPYDDSPRYTMLYNYPPEVQAAKIGSVTRLFEDVLERRPSSFRAGRFGFGAATADALLSHGYLVDSSVTPFFDWKGSSEGQDYVGAPLRIYRIDPESGVLGDARDGRLTEVPLTSGYTRLSPDSWEALARFLRRRPARALHLGAIGARMLGFRRAILSPEAHTVRDMMALATHVSRAGVGHLHLFFHSTSLVPGLSPFSPTSTEVERLFDRTEEVVERLRDSYELEFRSVTEAADPSARELTKGAVEEHRRLRILSPGPGGPDSRGPDGLETMEWFGPRGVRARLVHTARYTYWKLGGYRRFARVDWEHVERLVFVCSGNICRSPYAEHVARARSIEAVSLGVSTGPDGEADATALRVALDRGVPMDEHKTTPLGDFEPHEGDLFITMEPFQAALIGKQTWSVPHQITLLGLWVGSNGPVIADPYGGDEQTFAQCFSIIERGIDKIWRKLDRVSRPQSTGADTSSEAS